MGLTKLAESLIADGLSIMPINDKKVPTVKWDEYKKRLPNPGELKFEDRIGLVCGAVSGGVEVIDVEDIALQAGLMDVIVSDLEEQYPGLYERMVVATTPSGGMHLIYKCDVIEGNKKLAMRDKKTCLIETRGEGGYIAIDPTPGYKFIHGTPRKINRITPEERNIILDICRAQNEYFIEAAKPKQKETQTDGLTPWDDFDQRAEISSFLMPLGWKLVGQHGTNERWRRPEKPDGHSATWEINKRLFYNFSSSTELDVNVAYSASALFIKLIHAGDFKAGNNAIAQMGYGEKKIPDPKPTPSTKMSPTQMSETSKPNNKPWTRANDWGERLLSTYRKGKEHGESCGLSILDAMFRIRKGFMYCFTGWSQAGKTAFLNYLLDYQVSVKKRKVAMYSPESYPVDELIDDLIHVHTGKSVDRKYGNEALTEAEYITGIAWVHENFYFLDWEDTPDPKMMIAAWTQLHEEEGVEIFVADPFNSMQSDDPNISQELKRNLTKFKRFTTQRRIITFLVEHPKTPNDPADFGKLPNHRNLYGGTMWFNKVDIGVSIHRVDKDSDEVYIQTWKVKNQKLNGKPDTKTVLYDWKSQRYFAARVTEEQTKLPISTTTIQRKIPVSIELRNYSEPIEPAEPNYL